MQTPGVLDYEGLRYLQRYIFLGNDKRGFHEEGRFLKRALSGATSDRTQKVHSANLRNYIANKLMLISGEATEAHEELRKGRQIHERYYSAPKEILDYDAPPDTQIVPKPEGIPSELADIIIRVMDLSAEFDIDIAAVIEEKLRFNDTRPFMHGKQF